MENFLPKLKDWFEKYVEQFASVDPNIQAALDLKRSHTRRVCEAILDIGRFEQYRRYKTFSDRRSENHALLGVKVIQKNRILKDVDPAKARIIIRAVECHNRATLPANENGRVLFFMKLLRDADKVDIWRVVTDYYQNAHRERNQAIELDLPDTPEISDSVCQSLLKGNIVQMTDLRTLNDFKLLQIGWVYDVNFRRTFQIVRERGYLERIRKALPENSIRIKDVYERACDYLQRMTLKDEDFNKNNVYFKETRT